MVVVVPMVVERSHYGPILGDQCRRVNCFSHGRGSESDQWGFICFGTILPCIERRARNFW